MKPETRTIEAFNPIGGFERRKDDADPINHVRRQTSSIIHSEEGFEAFVPERRNHL